MKLLVSYLAGELNISERNASEMIRATIAVLKQRLRLHEWVLLNDIALFSIEKKNEKIVFDPVSMRKVILPPRLTVKMTLYPHYITEANRQEAIIRDLKTLVTIQANLEEKQAALFLNSLVEGIRILLRNKGRVCIKEFGVFKKIPLSSVTSPYLSVGKSSETNHSKVFFFPDKSLREEVNKPFAFFDTTIVPVKELPLSNAFPVSTFSLRKEKEVEDKQAEIEKSVPETREKSTPSFLSELLNRGEDEKQESVSSVEVQQKPEKEYTGSRLNMADFVGKIVDLPNSNGFKKDAGSVFIPEDGKIKEEATIHKESEEGSQEHTAGFTETFNMDSFLSSDSMIPEEMEAGKTETEEVPEVENQEEANREETKEILLPTLQDKQPEKNITTQVPDTISALLEEARQDVIKILEIEGTEEDGEIEELSVSYVKEDVASSLEDNQEMEPENNDAITEDPEKEREALIRKRFEKADHSAATRAEVANDAYFNFVDIDQIMNVVHEEDQPENESVANTEKKEVVQDQPAMNVFDINDIMSGFDTPEPDADKEDSPLSENRGAIPSEYVSWSEKKEESTCEKASSPILGDNSAIETSEENKEKEPDEKPQASYQDYEIEDEVISVRKYTFIHYLMLIGMFLFIFVTIGYFVSSYLKIRDKNEGIIHIDSSGSNDSDEVVYEEALQVIGNETISEGSDLSILAEKYYGNPVFWIYLYEANKDVIPDIHDIEAGTEIIIPNPEAYGFDIESEEAVRLAERKGNTLVTEK